MTTADRIAGLSDAQAVAIARALVASKITHAEPQPQQRVPDVSLAVLSGGRGSGKTWAGAYWLAKIIDTHPGADVGIVAPTFGDARDTNVEGESGLRALIDFDWNRSQGQGTLPGGGRLFCDGLLDGGERIEGKNLAAVWVDEIGLTRGPRATRGWRESIRFAVRKPPARILVTGTPKRGNPLVREVENRADHVARILTADNTHLDPAVRDAWLDEWGGTELGRQELEGILLAEVEGAEWTVACLDATRVTNPPELVTVAVGVDAALTTGTTGIVVVGRGIDGHLYVLADLSSAGTSDQWGRTIAKAAIEWDADVVVESEAGGRHLADLAQNLAGEPLRIHVVSARGMSRRRSSIKGAKAARAEPVAAHWKADTPTGHIVGIMTELEEELTTFDGTGKSPDRLDAMVWACHHLKTREGGGGVVTRNPATKPRPGGPNVASWRV